MTVAVLGMELCLVTLLLGWLWVVVTASAWPVPFVALLPGIGGLVAGRVIPYPWRRINWFDTIWWGTVAVFVAFLAEVGNVYWPGASTNGRWTLLFIAGLLLAWRGWVLAEGWIDRETVETELQMGTVVVLLLVGILAWQVPGAGLLPAVGFFGAGLIGLGIARRAERRGPRTVPETDWLALLGVMLAVLLVVCAAIVLLVTPELLTTLAEQAFTVAGVAVHGFAGLLAWIGGLFPDWGNGPAPTPPTTGAAPIPPTITGTPSRFDLPPFWTFEVILMVCGLAFLAYGIRTALRFMPRRLLWQKLPREKEPGPPVSDAVDFSWGGWWKLIFGWLCGLFRGERSATSRANGRVGGRAGLTVEEERSIRTLYREFLTAAERAGFDRSPSTTPAELANTLGRERPASQAPVSVLTELYVRTRYGQERVGRDEVSQMRSAVQRARGELTQAPREPEPDLEERWRIR